MLDVFSQQMKKEFIRELAKYTYKPGYSLSAFFKDDVKLYGIRLQAQRVGPKGEPQLLAMDTQFPEDDLLFGSTRVAFIRHQVFTLIAEFEKQDTIANLKYAY